MKHAIITMSLLALVSCKDGKYQETITNSDAVEHSNEAAEDHHADEGSDVYKNAWTHEIKMDNGTKWQADATTNGGVKQLQKTLNSQTTNTLEEYHTLAAKLNVDKNYVVKNCTMKGPSHDNLHVWLLPLMDKIDALSETTSIEDASKIKHSIDENINEYFTYFK